MADKKEDQKDIMAQLEKANADFKALKEDMTKLETENTGLKADKTKLEESQKDFDGKVRLKLIQHGVSTSAITVPVGDAKKADGTKMTLTERVLAAKGATTKTN